jgi:hypothetical protein
MKNQKLLLSRLTVRTGAKAGKPPVVYSVGC